MCQFNRKLAPLVFCSLALAVQSTFIARGPFPPSSSEVFSSSLNALPYPSTPCSGPRTLEPWSARFSMVPARRPYPHACVFTVFVLSILGIIVVLFFQCMAALFNPAGRGGEGVKWGFAVYTLATFSFVSIFTAVNALNVWFDDDSALRPARLGYVIPDLMFLLNYWLADGLLVCSSFDVALTRPGV